MFPTNIKSRFNLDPDIHFLNCATCGPFSKTVESAGIQSIQAFTPYLHQLKPNDFFERAWSVRALFSELVHNDDHARIAIVPSVSYAMAAMSKNLHRKPNLKAGQHILTVGDEFPSDVYAWDRVCKELSLEVKTVPQPQNTDNLTQAWNDRFIEAINENTALVVVPHVHWQFGTKFDLVAISEKVKRYGTLLAIDGTQSVGALDFDLPKIQPDLLVVVAYKWLMGPYSTGLAYFGEFFDDGTPIEEPWTGRQDSNLFHKLTDYQPNYQPKAFRYNMGQHSQFVTMPMLEVALQEKLEWGVNNIQAHCKTLWQAIVPKLQSLGIVLESENDRAHHLVGLRLPASTDLMAIQQNLAARNVFVAVRGTGLRVSPHIYNNDADMNALVEALAVVLAKEKN
jgi:selenocysteine lyase/cysteine desulfurase